MESFMERCYEKADITEKRVTAEIDVLKYVHCGLVSVRGTITLSLVFLKAMFELALS